MRNKKRNSIKVLPTVHWQFERWGGGQVNVCAPINYSLQIKSAQRNDYILLQSPQGETVLALANIRSAIRDPKFFQYKLLN